MNEQFPALKNKQRTTAHTFAFLALVTLVLMILPFIEGNPLSGAWALAFICIFLTISFTIITLIFRNRAKKMDKLKSGEKLLVQLQLDDEMLKKYASTLKAESKEKNKAVMWVIGILFLIITIPFLFLLESDERGGFLMIIGSVVLTVFMASRFFPGYYYRKNLKGDKLVLIGEKYAYFNGYFHNWDYPLSGLSKIKAIKTPFYGLHFAYFYTDRTWRHVQEIKLPLPEEFDPKPLIERMRAANKMKNRRN